MSSAWGMSWWISWGNSWGLLFDIPIVDLDPVEQIFVTRSVSAIYTEVETSQIVAYSTVNRISVRTAIEALHATQALELPVFCASPDEAIVAVIVASDRFVCASEPEPVITKQKQQTAFVG